MDQNWPDTSAAQDDADDFGQRPTKIQIYSELPNGWGCVQEGRVVGVISVYEDGKSTS